MASDLSLQFVLELVDRLSSPARDATRSLDGFKQAAEGLSGNGADLQAKGWVETSRAIGSASDAIKGYGRIAVSAFAANDNAATGWREAANAIGQATEATKTYESAVSEAVAKADGIAAAWTRANEQINYATGAAGRFKETGGGGGGAGSGGSGGGGHGGTFGESLKTATDLGLIMEAPRAIEETWVGGAHLRSETIAERIAGMKPDQIEESRKLGLQLQGQFPQFPLTEILSESREARAIFTSDEEARNALTPYLKMAALADRAHPGEGLKEAYPFLRAVEESGVTKDAHKTLVMFDEMQRAANAMGMKIKAEDYFTAFQHAGAFGRNWDDEFISYKLPHLLASLGGDAVGTMIATLGEAVQGGHMTGPALDTFESLGLIKPGFEEKKAGKVIRVRPGGIVGGDILGRDFVEWTQTVLWPAIQKKTSDPAQQFAIMTTALSNRNDLKAAYMGIMDVPQFIRTKELLASNKGLDAVDELQGDPTVGWRKLSSSLETLASITSDPLMGPISHGLDRLSGGISRFAAALDGHPVEQVALSLGSTGLLGWAGWKAFMGAGSAIGKWIGVGGRGAAAGVGAGEGVAAGAGTTAAGLSSLAAPVLGLGGMVYELGYRHSLLNDTMYAATENAPWSDPTHEFDWSDPAQRETALRQEYARQGERHPIMRGERDMEAAHGQAYGELAMRANDAAAALQSLFDKGNGTIAPNVDTRAVEALESMLERIVALKNQINGAGLSYSGGSRSGALHDGVEGGGRY